MRDCPCNWAPGAHLVPPLTQVTEKELLELAAAVEHESEHPLAAAVMEYAHARLQGPSWGAELGLELPQSSGLGDQRGSGQVSLDEETVPLVGLPSSPAAAPLAGHQARRTDWIRTVRDSEPSPGKPLWQI